MKTERESIQAQQRPLRFTPFLGILTAIFLLPSTAWPTAENEDEDGTLVVNEEIVVTARKREESLQRTPVSVTAFTEEALEARSLKNLRGVGDFTPNMTFTTSGISGGAPSEAVVYIRGIGHLGTGLFEDPAVGIYVDGVYLARAQGSVTDLLDLERIEVLRGPQGTLFGKNTIGGAINLVTKKPDSVFGGDVEVTVGELDRRDVALRVNGALSDKVFGSFAGLGASRDGYARSLATGEEVNGEDRIVARGALRFLASESVVVDLALDYTQDDIDGLDQVIVGFDQPAFFADFYNAVVASAGFPAYDEQFIGSNLFESYSGAELFHNGDVYGAHLTLAWNFGAANLTSITAFRRFEFDNSEDRDGAPFAFVDLVNHQEQDQFSQEIQISGTAAGDRLTWLVGGLFFQEDSRQDGLTTIFENLFEALEAAPGPIFAFPVELSPLCGPDFPCFGGAGNPFNLAFGFGFDTADRHEVETWALFGQGTYSVTERLSVTFGLRYSFEEKELNLRRRTLPFPQTVDLTSADDWDAFSPKIGLEWQATPELFLYGSVSWGFKSGGFNGITQAGGDIPTFDEENLLAYELGFKSDWLANRLRLNTALFWNDYTDIQFSASRVGAGGNVDFVIQNAGEAESKGVEVELEARPSSTFSLTAGVGYLDTGYTELRGLEPGGATLDGVFPKSPEWTANFSPQLTFDAGAGDLVARADYSYRSRTFHDVGNSPLVAQEAFGLVNARLEYITSSDRWKVSLFATNLTDEEYIQQGIFIFGFGPALAIPGRPREWGLAAEWRF